MFSLTSFIYVYKGNIEFCSVLLVLLFGNHTFEDECHRRRGLCSKNIRCLTHKNAFCIYVDINKRFADSDLWNRPYPIRPFCQLDQPNTINIRE